MDKDITINTKLDGEGKMLLELLTKLNSTKLIQCEATRCRHNHDRKCKLKTTTIDDGGLCDNLEDWVEEITAKHVVEKLANQDFLKLFEMSKVPTICKCCGSTSKSFVSTSLKIVHTNMKYKVYLVAFLICLNCKNEINESLNVKNLFCVNLWRAPFFERPRPRHPYGLLLRGD